VKSGAFYKLEDDVLVPIILGTPGASKDAIGKPEGHPVKVSVIAAPCLGKATGHMLRILAVEFGMAQSAIEVMFGRKNVNQQLRIRQLTKLPGCVVLPVAALPVASRFR
jgi:uncharacterized protein YggU (UPF0235/DUF167 family)